MVCQDWRACTEAEIAPLLAAEIRACRRELDWDVTEAWKVVEPARRAGRLPGLVARDAVGRIVGWTSFLLHHGGLQVLAFEAPDAPVAAALLNAIADTPEAVDARSTIVCVRQASAPLAGMLERRGFDVEPYRYLQMHVETRMAATHGFRPWQDDLPAMARLCQRAYAGSTAVRAFAPGGTFDEWIDYLATLMSGPGCGWFMPEISFVRPSDDGRRLDAAVIVTDLGAPTVHVAQVVVDPDARRRGVGRRLIQASAEAARALGYTQMTLLVSASNRPAVAMYEALGFADRAMFVVATRSQPILSTRLALTMGGESTRR